MGHLSLPTDAALQGLAVQSGAANKKPGVPGEPPKAPIESFIFLPDLANLTTDLDEGDWDDCCLLHRTRN